MTSSAPIVDGLRKWEAAGVHERECRDYLTAAVMAGIGIVEAAAEVEAAVKATEDAYWEVLRAAEAWNAAMTERHKR